MSKRSRDELISTAKAAAELGVTRRRVQALIDAGRLAATRVGLMWIIRRGDLEAVRHRKPGRPKEKRPVGKKRTVRQARRKR